MLSFLCQQFLPIGLVAAALVGLVLPGPGRHMATLPTQQVAVSIIFVCAGLRLPTDEVRRALTAWKATLWGALSVLLVTPVLGALIAFRLPLDPWFRLGLALFCCMPTTLSSGIALTGQARGSVALALFLTVLTNFAGILTVPFVLTVLLNTVGHIELSAQDLLAKLCVSILLPLLAGKVLRHYLLRWADRYGAAIRTISNVALISIPWMQFSQSSSRLAVIGAMSIVLIVVGGLGIHVVYLLLNEGATRLLRLSLPARRAVVLVASEKTLPVSLTVLAFLPVPAEAKGLIAVPCVTSHLGQIFMDAVLATRWGNAVTAVEPQPEPG